MLGARVIWFTGLSGSGKTTLSTSLAERLVACSHRVEVLDADELRRELCVDLGFSLTDRRESIRRIAFVAGLLAQKGITALVAAICPLNEMRAMVRAAIPDVIEVFVDAPLETCEMRDPKGLYKRARRGLITEMTGIDSPFEPPLNPAVTCYTDRETIAESTEKILAAIETRIAKPALVQESRRRTLAVDFDGVIANYDGWKGERQHGLPRRDVLDALNTLQREGWKIVIHTTRFGADIQAYLRQHQIPYDEINRNSDYNNRSGKPVATVYWDDRALRYSGDASVDLPLIRNFATWSGRQ